MDTRTRPAVITVEPDEARIDEDVLIRVRGLESGEEVQIEATAVQGDHQRWRSGARFRAGSDGVVDVSSQAPEDGSYEGIDPMGLLWSLEPLGAPVSPGASGGVEARSGAEPRGLDRCAITTGGIPPLVTTIVARRAGGGSEPSGRLVRHVVPPAVRSVAVDDPVIGTLYLPADLPAPAAVVLGGSEGGRPAGLAALLAAHGFCALALGYFGGPPLSEDLIRVPVDSVGVATRWLRTLPETTPGRPGLVGVSRGAELALLTAALSGEARAVVGYSGSGVAGSAFTRQWWRRPRAAWTWDGRDVPYLSGVPSPRLVARFVRAAVAPSPQPVATRPYWERLLTKPRRVERAAIPVERTDAPILLHSGEDDQVWPAAELSDIAVRRRQGVPRSTSIEHHVYAGAGHVIHVPYLPFVPGMRPAAYRMEIALGGTATANVAAARLAWPRTIAFLEEHLRSPDRRRGVGSR